MHAQLRLFTLQLFLDFRAIFFPEWPLPLRDCAASYNSSVPRRLKMSAIKQTAKTLFKRLYLVLGLSLFEPRVNGPCPSTPVYIYMNIYINIYI